MHAQRRQVSGSTAHQGNIGTAQTKTQEVFEDLSQFIIASQAKDQMASKLEADNQRLKHSVTEQQKIEQVIWF